METTMDVAGLAASQTWLPEVTGADRLVAARAYRACVDQGVSKMARRARYEAACRAVGLDYAVLVKSREAGRRQAEVARQQADFSSAVEAARLPIAEILPLAMRHEEKSRWANAGSWTNRRWRLEVSHSSPVPAGKNTTVWRAANGLAYESLVSVLGRRSWNHGGGERMDVTAETKNDPARVRLARDIIAGKNVDPRRLMSISDVHARAWAVGRCGGWERVTGLLPLLERTPRGELFDGAAAGLSSDLLVVRDPSTGRKYALHAPRPGRRNIPRTVDCALRAINRVAASKIVAES